MDCIFCKIIQKQLPAKIVKESEQVIVFNDINPKAPIHYLIVPKKHINDIQSLEQSDINLANHMFDIAKQISKDLNADFKFVINSGAQAGQRVFHLHAHFLSGKVSSFDF